MATQVDEEKAYLNDELSNIESTVRMSSDSFEECSRNVITVFDSDFEKFQTSVRVSTIQAI